MEFYDIAMPQKKEDIGYPCQNLRHTIDFHGGIWYNVDNEGQEELTAHEEFNVPIIKDIDREAKKCLKTL